MIGKTIASLTALTALVNAQVAPGFPFTAPTSLTVVFGDNTVSPAGELIPRGDTANPPKISSPAWSATPDGSQKALLMMVDLDVPRNGTRVPLIHWIASGVTVATNSTGGTTVPLNIPTGEVPYLQPSPPVGDIPHTYTLILFQQPNSWAFPMTFVNSSNNRLGFDGRGFNLTGFVTEPGLGPVIAANYIRVQNLTGSATMSFPPSRPTSSGAVNSSAPATFPGAASQSVNGGQLAIWMGVGMAVVSGLAAFAL